MAANIALESWDFKDWSYRFIPIFSLIIMLGLEAVSFLVPFLCTKAGCDLIPIKGKHLDKLTKTDLGFIAFNKTLTILFTYHLIYVCYYCDHIKKHWSEATLLNTVGSLIGFYIFYDFFYCQFHRILHLRWLYPYIHKHHHRQKAPTRGNLDAMNVHPFEFLVGEYLHIMTIYFVPCHIYAVAVFIVLGGILASLNHTRFDIKVPFNIFRVDVHDTHHRIPESNYSQYIILWDYIFGSLRW